MQTKKMVKFSFLLKMYTANFGQKASRSAVEPFNYYGTLNIDDKI